MLPPRPPVASFRAGFRPAALVLPRVLPHQWLPLPSRRPACIPPAAWEWLSWPASITRRLAELSGKTVSVQILSEGRSAIPADEQALLGPRATPAVVREVRLLAGTLPCVEARTVLPLATTCGSLSGLLRLGKTPLGSALFQSATPPRRRHWQIRQLPPLQAGHPPRWARRTVYLIQGRPLLVYETFAPCLYPSP